MGNNKTLWFYWESSILHMNVCKSVNVKQTAAAAAAAAAALSEIN